MYGGSGSGKSHFVGQEIIMNMMQNGDYSYLALRKTRTSIEQSVFLLLTTLINEYGLKYYFITNKTKMSITCITGAKFVTSGLDDPEKLKSIVGVNRIWVEEASEITEKDFKQLNLRMRGKNKLGYQMTLTFNPISELHWLKRAFFDIGKSNSFILKTTYKDNLFIDEEYKRELESYEHEDYQYYRIYTLGEWGSLGNLIFTNWRKENLKPIMDTFDNIFNGCDFGFAEDPFAFIRPHYDKKHKKIYILKDMKRKGLHNDEAAEILKPIIANEILTCDSSEPKSIADLKRNGINAKGAKKGKDSVMYGIKWLQGKEIIVDEDCTETIKELSGYKWREDKDGVVIPKPVDINNHLMDALRYALESEMIQANTQWGWNKEE